MGEERKTRRNKQFNAEKQAHWEKKYGKKVKAKKAKLIELTQPTEENNNDGGDGDDSNEIDDEEEGGEWITEENLHKHLSNGLMLPIVPIEAENGK